MARVAKGERNENQRSQGRTIKSRKRSQKLHPDSGLGIMRGWGQTKFLPCLIVWSFLKRDVVVLGMRIEVCAQRPEVHSHVAAISSQLHFSISGEARKRKRHCSVVCRTARLDQYQGSTKKRGITTKPSATSQPPIHGTASTSPGEGWKRWGAVRLPRVSEKCSRDTTLFSSPNFLQQTCCDGLDGGGALHVSARMYFYSRPWYFRCGGQ